MTWLTGGEKRRGMRWDVLRGVLALLVLDAVLWLVIAAALYLGWRVIS